jgi:mRNA interferase MazF
MKEADIILTPILQADGQTKNRPALILRDMPRFNDFLVCGVSSQLHQKVEDFDEIISAKDEDFANSGITDSLVRLAFLAVLPRAKIIGSIGSISSTRHHQLLKNLSDYLIKENA